MALYPNGPTLNMDNKVVAQNYDKMVNNKLYDTLVLKDLMGSTVNSAIYVPKQLTGTAGNTTTIQIMDNTKYNYNYGNAVTLLKEQTMNYFPDQVKLDQVDHVYAIGSSASIEKQSLAFSDLDSAKDSNVIKMAEWHTGSFFAQLAGVEVIDGATGLNGFNALTAPTNVITGKVGTDIIAQAVAMAKKLRFQPASNNATGSNFILYLSPDDEAAFRIALNAQTFDLSKAIAIASKNDKTLSQDLLGTYYGVELRSNFYVPAGKAFLLGGQAISLVPGSEFEGNLTKTFTYEIDGNHIGVKTTSIIGIKKTQFNGKDFGVVTINFGGK